MTPKTTIQLTLAALVAAATAVPAFGASEPKNQVPFTRQAAPVTAQPAVARGLSALAGIVPTGEAKNETPFTARFNADPGYTTALREADALQLRTLQVGRDAL